MTWPIAAVVIACVVCFTAAALRSALTAKPQGECEWEIDSIDYEPDRVESSCGHSFEVGVASELKFCPYCGKPVRVKGGELGDDKRE